MRTGRPKTTLTISNDERTHLLAVTRSRSLPAALTLRAKIVLACEREPSNAVVATRLGVGPHTIGKWRNRFITHRIEGLYDEMRSGRPRTVEDEAVAELITKTLARKPKAATHWSVRAISKETGIAKSTVHRLFQLFGLQPHRTRSFKLSNDPFFVEKLRDVVGLYLNPPDKAVVLCVDEKSQIQALERTQPMLPMGFGYIEGVTHDYQRHGTTTLFAALNVLDGAIIAQCKPRHRSRRRQLRHPQASQGQSLARTPSALAYSLHAYLCLLAQPGRTLLRPHHSTRYPPRLFRFHHRPRQKNRPLHPHPQCKFTALRLDRYC
jgi:putative transposase